MGKKDKKVKKKGAEKTAEKTEKKLKQKTKKELAVKGEDDIEEILKSIESEEKKRTEVKIKTVDPPSQRSGFTITPHPEQPEIIFFGGEFYNGSTTKMFSDLLIYNTKKNNWTQISSPAGPPPRSSHQAALVTRGGGQLWIFGGEYTSPSESQFYHHKDLWCYHFSSKRWEKVIATGSPSGRSGHRMVAYKNLLIVFGGFHDNLRDCRYFNDLYAFDLDNRTWKTLETTGPVPSPRSACQFLIAPDGRICLYGGYCKQKLKKDVEKGVTHTDMFFLSPMKHDETLTKWRWQNVKQVGMRASLRTGLSSTLVKDRILMFGGVCDKEEDEEELDSDSDDEGNEDSATFFNELYSIHFENERATWSLVKYTGKKEDRKNASEEDGSSQEDEVKKLEDMSIDAPVEEPKTLTVESGAFTISSTIGLQESNGKSEGSSKADAIDSKLFNVPTPRFNAGITFKGGRLYLYGGMVETGDKDLTLCDFHWLDTHKMDAWNTIIENNKQKMEWVEEESDDEEGEDSEGDSEDMDTE